MTTTLATQARDAADQILDRGYAIMRLTGGDLTKLEAAFDEGRTFFRRPIQEKLRHGSDDNNHGYRPQGVEFSATADRPDLNDVFTFWHDRTDLIGAAEEIPEFLAALAAWRNTVSPFVRELLTLLAAHFGSDDVPDFEAASHLQMNAYFHPRTDRDILQDLHEDVHLITVQRATGPGLEARIGDEIVPVETRDDEVVVFPSSVLTDLSGGAIAPFYHRVRDMGTPDRMSLMYFVNPTLDRPLLPWTGEKREDLREKVRNAPAMFGLAEVPEL